MMNNKGFSLVEAMISVTILSFILLVAYGILTTGNTVYSRDSALLDMQQQVRNGMDRIVREVRESSTQTITVIDANNYKITFTTPNETNIMYYRSGTNLVREYPANTIKIVASNIAFLKFVLSTKLLNVQLRGDTTVNGGTTISFPLTENVRLRN